MDDVGEQLRALGASAAVIADWKARQGQQQEVEVWECNLRTVQLFQVCQLSWLVGMAGATCLGLSMVEIRAALDAYAVPAETREEVAGGLVLMGRVAARCLNRSR